MKKYPAKFILLWLVSLALLSIISAQAINDEKIKQSDLKYPIIDLSE